MTERKDREDRNLEPDVDPEAAARREFLKTFVRGVSVAPAVALLLAANEKSASAQNGGCGCGCGCGSILDSEDQ